MRDRIDFFNGARVRCGACGKQQDFSEYGGGGGDTLARRAGWQLEWRPRPFVRCPACRPTPSTPTSGAK